MQKIDQELRAINCELVKNPDSERLKNIKAALLNNKALLLGQAEKYSDALKFIDQALALNSSENLFAFTSNKASFLHKASRFNDSIECAQKILELDVNNEKAIEILVLNYSSQAAIENEKGNNSEALVKVFNTDLRFWFKAILIVFYKLKIDKAIELKPRDSILLYNKANILNELGKFEDSLSYIDQSLQIDPSLGSAKSLQAFIYHKMASNEADKKNYEEAVAILNKAIELNPYEIAFFINKSSFLFKLKKYNESAECADKALALQSSNQDALNLKKIVSKYLK